MYTQAIKQIKAYLEQTNDIISHKSLNELLERKGLSPDFKWVLLATVKSRYFAWELLMSSILAEAFEKVVSLETYFSSFKNDGTSYSIYGSDQRNFIKISLDSLKYLYASFKDDT